MQALHAGEMRRVTGNSLHLQVVGCQLMHLLASLRLEKKSLPQFTSELISLTSLNANIACDFLFCADCEIHIRISIREVAFAKRRDSSRTCLTLVARSFAPAFGYL